MKKQKPYTVVGYFEDTGKLWMTHDTAQDWSSAVVHACKSIHKRDDEPFDNIVVVEVFTGHILGQTEHSYACTASDFPGVSE